MAIEVVGTRNNGARLALACLSGDKADLLGWAVEKSLWTGSTAYCMDTGESLVYDRASGAWWPVSTGGGGGGDVTVEQNKAVSITKQDATEVTPSVGYNAMAKVTATPVLQEKTAASNGDIEPDAGYAGLKKVTVAVPAAPEGQTKDVRITQNGVSSVSPDNGFVLNQVNIETDVAPNLQNKTITQNGRYVADDEYDGLGEVTVDVAGGGALEENKEVTITENGTTEIVPTSASESCYTDFTRRYNEDGSVSQSSIPAGTVESQNQIGSMYTANGVNYTSGGEGLYLYYFQIEDAATHETLALPANAKKSSRIGANAISGGEEQYDMDVENGYTIACYDGVLYLKNGDDYYFNFDFSISNWNDLYYSFFNVGIGGTKVTDAALIAALNAVTFAASIKLYSLYGEFFYPVTGFTQFSIGYDSDKDAAGSIWEYGDTNNQYPYIVRYDKVGTFLALNEAQPTDIYYATYGGIKQYDGMEKVTVTTAIPLEENKAVSLTAPGETEITPTSGNAGMEKVTVTPVLQDKTITENGTYSADSGNAGLGEVTVAVPLEANKAVSITENGTVEIEPSSGKTAMEKVTATVAIPLEENKAVEITENGTVEIEPSSGKTAMEKVTVTAAIPLEEEKVVQITAKGTTDILPSDGNVAVKKVTVDVPHVLKGYTWNGSGRWADDVVTTSGNRKLLKTDNDVVSLDEYKVLFDNLGVVAKDRDVSSGRMTYNNGIYIHVYTKQPDGDDGRRYFVKRSTDGVTWSEEQQIPTRASSYGNITEGLSNLKVIDGKFVVYGINDFVAVSDDGIAWTIGVGLNNASTIYDVASDGNGTWLCGCYDGYKIRKSTDYGATWTNTSISTDRFVLKLRYENGWFANCTYGEMYYSADGETWISKGDLSNAYVVYDSTLQMWVASKGGKIIMSSDLDNWQEKTTSGFRSNVTLSPVVYNGLHFALPGSSNQKALVSRDYLVWEELETSYDLQEAELILASEGLLIAGANAVYEYTGEKFLTATIGADTYPLVRDSTRDVEF